MARSGKAWTKFNQGIAIKFGSVAEFIGIANYYFTPRFNDGQPETVVVKTSLDPAVYGWALPAAPIKTPLVGGHDITTIGPDNTLAHVCWNYWRHPDTKETVSWQGHDTPYEIRFDNVMQPSNNSPYVQFRGKEYKFFNTRIIDVKFLDDVVYVVTTNETWATLYTIDTTVASPFAEGRYDFWDDISSTTESALAVFDYETSTTQILNTHTMTVQDAGSPIFGARIFDAILSPDCSDLSILMEGFRRILSPGRPGGHREVYDGLDFVLKLTQVSKVPVINSGITDPLDADFRLIEETGLPEGATHSALLAVGTAVGSTEYLNQDLSQVTTTTTTSTKKDATWNNQFTSWWGGSSSQNTTNSACSGAGTWVKPEDTTFLQGTEDAMINSLFAFTGWDTGSGTIFVDQVVTNTDKSNMFGGGPTALTGSITLTLSVTMKDHLGDPICSDVVRIATISTARANIQFKEGDATYNKNTVGNATKPYNVKYLHNSLGEREWLYYDYPTNKKSVIYKETLTLKEVLYSGTHIVSGHAAHATIVAEVTGFLEPYKTSKVETDTLVTSEVEPALFHNGNVVSKDCLRHSVTIGYKNVWKHVIGIQNSPLDLVLVEDHDYQSHPDVRMQGDGSNNTILYQVNNASGEREGEVYGCWYFNDERTRQTPVDVTLTGDLIVKKRGQINTYGVAQLSITVNGVEQKIVDRVEKSTGTQETPATASGTHQGSRPTSVSGLPNVGSPTVTISEPTTPVYFQWGWSGFRVPLGDSGDFIYSGFLFYSDDEVPLYEAKYMRNRLWVSDATGAVGNSHDATDGPITYNTNDILELPREDGSVYDLTALPASGLPEQKAIGLFSGKK